MAAPASLATTAEPIAEATDQEIELLKLVCWRVEAFENGIGQDFKQRNDRFYQQYRGFKRYEQAYKGATKEPDRDEVVQAAAKEWGASLHIPMSFRTIETMVPRMIAQRPRIIVLPREERWEQNVRPVKMLLDAQQEAISIDLPLQSVARAGCIYGLGVSKCYWRKTTAPHKAVRPRRIGRGYVVPKEAQEKVTFDDPVLEDVDVYDFMWDPRASDVDTAQWLVHRVWLSTEQVLQRVATKQWSTAGAQVLDAQKIRGLGGARRYDEIWNERMMASGFSSYSTVRDSDHPHEVLEYHDGRNVIVVLDRAVVVAVGESPTVGMMPFQVYRPIPLAKQMVGIGYLEPLEHLQRELDTLRSQRRDAATLALNGAYAFDEAAVEEDDIVFGPGVAIPVTNRDPRDAIVPLQVRDVPGSGWQEEQAIRSDFDQISGVDEDQTAGGGNQMTATGAMMSSARTSRRVALQGRRFEIEVLKPAGRVMLALNQRMILQDRSLREVDHGGDEVGDGDPNVGRWKWATIGPGELRGEFEVVIEGGSMAERNIPQDRQDAVQLLQTFGGRPEVDQRRLLLEAIKKFGYEDPLSWLKQQEKPVPQLALQLLEQMGVEGELIQFAVTKAQQQDPMAMVPAGGGGDDPTGQEPVQMRPEAVQTS